MLRVEHTNPHRSLSPWHLSPPRPFRSPTLALHLTLCQQHPDAAEIENLDRLFSLVLAQVDAQGDTANTVVCIASDHGEMLGDHGDVDKSKPWEGSAHVPLMCAGPGILANHTVTLPVATMVGRERGEIGR